MGLAAGREEGHTFRSMATGRIAIHLFAGVLLLAIPAVFAFNAVFSPWVLHLDWGSPDDLAMVGFVLFLAAFGVIVLVAALSSGRTRRLYITGSDLQLSIGRRIRWTANWQRIDLMRTSKNRGIEVRVEGKWAGVGSRFGDRTLDLLPEEALQGLFRQAAERRIPVDDPTGRCSPFGFTFAPPPGVSEDAVQSASGVWNNLPVTASKPAGGWAIVAAISLLIAVSVVPGLFGQPIISLAMAPLVLLIAFRNLVAVNLGGALDVVVGVKFDGDSLALRYKDGHEVTRGWGDVELCRCSPSEGSVLLKFQDEARLRPCTVSPAAAEAMRRAFLATLVAMKQVFREKPSAVPSSGPYG